MKGLIIPAICLYSLIVNGQITADRIQNFVLPGKQVSTTSFKYPPAIRDFYTEFDFKPAWIQPGNPANCYELLNIVKQSANRGLYVQDYNIKLLEALCNNTLPLKNLQDSIQAEISITELAIHFYSDVAYGNTKPQFGYNGLEYRPHCFNIPVLLANYITRNSLSTLINLLSPALVEIAVLENSIKRTNTIMAETNFKEVTIKSNKINAANTALVVKLYQLSVIDSIATNLPITVLKQAVTEAQRRLHITPDGVLSAATLDQLNVPLHIRLQQLNLAVNYYRWLNCLVQNEASIVVNIPSAYMKVYYKSKSILEMRMVLGKKTTPTPMLTSRVNQVILYPYWYVPNKIIFKELLPLFRKSPAIVDALNFQILNRSGKIISPYKINWDELNADDFPYIVRQSTGCDNSLGVLKLDFYSPYGVYLHDTPEKKLFSRNTRYFSHGCLRMERPLELRRMILKDNRIAIDTLEEKGCLPDQSPIFVPAQESMPVIVWYNPAGIDSTGRVVFYGDVYRKFSWKKSKTE